MFPLLWISTAFLVGLILNGTFHLPRGVLLIGVFISLILAILEWRFKQSKSMQWWRKFAPLSPGVILCAFFIGALRFPIPAARAQPDQLAYYLDQKGTLTGTIASQPERTEHGQSFTLSASRFTGEPGISTPVSGMALVQITSPQELEYGDRLTITGLVTPPGSKSSASYQEYLRRKGIQAQVLYPQELAVQKVAGKSLHALLLKLRTTCEQVIAKIFPQPEAALVDGVLLGRAGNLPDSLIRAYQATGTAHIFAVSGFNIAVMAGVFLTISKRILSRWYGVLLAIPGIVFYALLVGGSPSVVRAAIMGSLGIVAQMIGRRSAGITSLAFTAAIMCLFDACLPWDVSFQLSFMATLGLMLFAGPLQKGLEGWLAERMPSDKARRWAQPIGEYFLFTLAAQVMTLPVIAYHFQRLSLSAVLANPLVLPAQPLLMTLGVVALLGGMIFLPLGKLLAGIAWPLAAYTNRVTEWLAGLGGELSLHAISLWSVLVFYLLIFLLIVFHKRWKQQATLAAGLLASGLVALVIWQGVLARPDGRLHVTVLGIQDSTAILVQTPAGNHILIDSAPDSAALGSALDHRLSLFEHRLEAVVLTRGSASSLDALSSVLENLPADAVYWGIESDTVTARQLKEQLTASDTPVKELDAHTRLSLDEGVILTVGAKTETGRTLTLEYGSLKIFIPAGQQSFSKEDAKGADVLLIAEHDLKRTSAGDWNTPGAVVFWIEPQLASPDPRWISLAQKDWLEINIDGNRMWITGK